MLRAVKLSTKLTLLVATGVVATLAIGIPGAIDRVDRSRTATDRSARITTLQTLARFHELADREATLSAWYVASGEPAAQRTLATVRPQADRLARSLDATAVDGPMGPAVARVQREWSAVRQSRAAVDRRVVTDAVALGRSDGISRSIRRALDVGIATDTGAATGAVRARAALDDLRAAAASEQAAIAVAISRAAVAPELLARLRTADAAQSAGRDRALASTRDAVGPSIDAELGALRAATVLVHTTRGPALLGVTPFITPAQWQQRSDDQIHALASLGRSVDTTANARTAAETRDARAAVTRWFALLGAIVAAVILIGLVLARSVRRPLRALRGAAVGLADRERAALASPDATRAVPTVAPPAVGTEDEVGDIARAVHGTDQAIVESLSVQRRVRQNDLSDLYVNIARRNQPLLSRQLAVIDALESSEPDAGRSASLAQLDHLAVRMRRNSESLLVLAGLDPLRSHPEPVRLLDVIHGALGEIEEFARVDIVEVPADIAVLGQVVVDLVHALAELIENATIYSPPASRVVISTLQRPGAIDVTVSDAGAGLPVDRLDALNEQLQHPPLPGFDLSRSLGLVVVARLCERIGVRAALRRTPGVGTAAVIAIPISLVVGTESPSPPPVPRPIPTAPPLIDLTLPESITTGSSPSGTSDDRLPHPVVVVPLVAPPVAPLVAPPLPRRQRAESVLEPVRELQPPESRPPTAVFELVARFEAGRRRAAQTEAADDSDEPRP